jgi:hypothetical protein
MKDSIERILSGASAGKEIRHTNDPLIILPEFLQLIPTPSPEELQQLEANIQAEGVREPLIVWRFEGQTILVDGHNRFSIASKHGLKFSTCEMQFKSKQDAADWMVRNQLGRRNLTPEQQSYLRGLQYNQQKQPGKRREQTSAHFEQRLGTTAEMLAKVHDVSASTIRRDGKFAQEVDAFTDGKPELRTQVLSGRVKLPSSQPQKAPKVKTKNANSKPKEVTLTLRAFAEVCLKYVQEERSVFQDVCTRLGLPAESVSPVDFFLAWSHERVQFDSGR